MKLQLLKKASLLQIISLKAIESFISKWQCEITTKEPSEKEIEVALAALNELF